MSVSAGRRRLNALLPWLFLAGAYVLLIGFYARYGMNYQYGDISTDMVMARHLNTEGVLLSEHFWYTTELRILNVVNFYQLGFLLFPDNWFMVRLFAIAVMLPLLAASFIYMARGAGLKESAVWAAGAILLPCSSYYLFLVSYGLCYVCYVIMLFVQMGLALRIASRERGRAVRLALLAVWCVLSGLQGLRMVLMSAVTMGAAAGLLLLIRAAGCSSFRELLSSWEARFTLAAIVNGVCITLGYLVNAVFFVPRYHFTEFTSGQPLFRFHLEDLWAQVDAVLRELGWNAPVRAAGFRGLLSVLAVLLIVFLIVSLLTLLLRRLPGTDAPQLALFALAAACLVWGIWLNAMICNESSYSPSYFMGGVMLLIGSGFFLLEKLPVRLPAVRLLSTLLLAGVFLLETMGTLTSGYIPRAETPLMKAAGWLTDNGYTQGYATFWDADPLTEASNGQLETWILLDFSSPDRIYPWGQVTSHGTGKPEGRVFLFAVRDADTYQWMRQNQMGRDADWLMEDGGSAYFIYTADSVEELFTFRAMAAPAPEAD